MASRFASVSEEEIFSMNEEAVPKKHKNGNKVWSNSIYYPTLLRRVQISRETNTNNRYLYSPHSSRPREVQNLGKSEFWEKKSLDNKSLIRRFGV